MSKKILFCAALVLAIFAGAAQKRQVMLDRVNHALEISLELTF